MYRQSLEGVEGIRLLPETEGVKHNYAYFPIFIDKEKYGMSRDDLYNKLKENNILARRYFYPLISNFPTYRGLESATPDNLPLATKLAEQVLCLPMYAGLEEKDVLLISDLVCKR